jgi:hypothetical protein
MAVGAGWEVCLSTWPLALMSSQLFRSKVAHVGAGVVRWRQACPTCTHVWAPFVIARCFCRWTLRAVTSTPRWRCTSGPLSTPCLWWPATTTATVSRLATAAWRSRWVLPCGVALAPAHVRGQEPRPRGTHSHVCPLTASPCHAVQAYSHVRTHAHTHTHTHSHTHAHTHTLTLVARPLLLPMHPLPPPSLQAIAGVTYRIQVDGSYAERGTARVALTASTATRSRSATPSPSRAPRKYCAVFAGAGILIDLTPGVRDLLAPAAS